MAILDIVKDYNPRIALKNIFSKISEIIKQLNTNTEAIAAVEPTYKKYVALLTQTGTSAPVATVLENTLSGTPVWSYVGVGVYNLELTGEFPSASKIVVTFGAGEGSTDIPTASMIYFTASIVWNSADDIDIYIAKICNDALLNMTYQDSLLTNAAIEIRVYQ